MKYNIGIKYCGGCNPRYDRVNTKNSLEKKIRELFERKKSSVNLGYARENEFYHCLLLIGGCGNCCMSFEEYDTIDRSFEAAFLKSIRCLWILILINLVI